MSKEETLLKEWTELYDSAFPPLKQKYDATCKVFADWNVRKIDTETAIKRFKALMEDVEAETKEDLEVKT